MRTVHFTERQLAYLAGKVRQDIRTRRRYLASPPARSDLGEEETREMLRRRRSELRFREELYALLGGNPGDLTLEDKEREVTS